MLLALVGVTGIGKSYYVDKLVNEKGFKKVRTIRTREKRKGEVDGKDGLFLSNEELDKLDKEGKIAYRFSVFGGEYAYLKEDIFSKDNMVFEMHYTTINDWKKVAPNVKTIYLLPKELEKAKDKTRQRNLSKEKLAERLQEIDEHYNTFMNNKSLQDLFDVKVYNNYDIESDNNLMAEVDKLLQGA